MQKTFPSTSKAIADSPRQCVHGSTPARFIAPICGPNNSVGNDYDRQQKHHRLNRPTKVGPTENRTNER